MNDITLNNSSLKIIHLGDYLEINQLTANYSFLEILDKIVIINNKVNLLHSDVIFQSYHQTKQDITLVTSNITNGDWTYSRQNPLNPKNLINLKNKNYILQNLQKLK